jgi:5-methylcytosine-specific restriction endonuclease McrA
MPGNKHAFSFPGTTKAPRDHLGAVASGYVHPPHTGGATVSTLARQTGRCIAMVRFTSCRVCGIVCQGGICPQHAAEARTRREAARVRPGPSSRGYGPAYRQARARLAKQLQAIWEDQNDDRDLRNTDGDARYANRDLRNPDLGMSIREVHCVICGYVIHKGDPWTAEHLVPLSRGGRSELANLGPAHPRCNYARTNTR